MDIFRTPLSYGPSPTGLRKDANSCALPLGCSQETNTCDVCTSDAECQGPILHRNRHAVNALREPLQRSAPRGTCPCGKSYPQLPLKERTARPTR